MVGWANSRWNTIRRELIEMNRIVLFAREQNLEVIKQLIQKIAPKGDLNMHLVALAGIEPATLGL